MRKVRIKIINGVNLNMLGKREGIYGNLTMEEMNLELAEFAKDKSISLDFFQSNHEGDIIDELHKLTFVNENNAGYEGVIINAGAYSHYSYAIHDALQMVRIPKLEVHLTDVMNREEWRHKLITAAACDDIIAGKGVGSYKQAIINIAERVAKTDEFFRNNNIILIGMMCCGKSFVAELLAREFSLQLYDIDKMYEDRFESIKVSFEERGEQHFRQNESSIISELAVKLSKQAGCVVATGGGSVLSPQFSELKEQGRVVYLHTDIRRLKERLAKDGMHRPLAKCLEELYVLRKELYAKLADITIDTTNLTIEEVALNIKNTVI